MLDLIGLAKFNYCLIVDFKTNLLIDIVKKRLTSLTTDIDI